MNTQHADAPSTDAQWLEIFNHAWLAVPLDIRLKVLEDEAQNPREVAHYLTRAINMLVQAPQALQARLDLLMWEYCPEDMTDEQRATWAAHQRVAKEPGPRFEPAPADDNPG